MVVGLMDNLDKMELDLMANLVKMEPMVLMDKME